MITVGYINNLTYKGMVKCFQICEIQWAFIYFQHSFVVKYETFFTKERKNVSTRCLSLKEYILNNWSKGNDSLHTP